jgi:GIY-YIG catalytic domain
MAAQAKAHNLKTFNVYIYRVTKLSPTLEDNLSIGRQTRSSIGYKQHGMHRVSYILNTKVVCFKPRLQGVCTLNSVRFESNAATSLHNSKISRTLNLVKEEDIVKGNPVNSEVINSVLLNQKVAISQKELDKLLNLPSVKFDLPITDETHPSLLALLRKPHSKRSNSGVYIFTHKPTGSKYVGSSNDLVRRFKQYFDKDLLFANKNYGLLMPLINEKGLDVFSLQVIVVPYSYPKYSYNFLEQYFLLDKSFDLNTQRIVNFRVNQGFKVFLYDLDCKTLYHSSNSLNAFCADLGIHSSSYRKCISSGVPYLGLFVISNTLIEDAVSSNLTESEVCELLAKRRKENLDKQTVDLGKVIEVFDKDKNERKTYLSIYKVAYRLGTTRTTIRSYITNGKAYKNRYCLNFSDNSK